MHVNKILFLALFSVAYSQWWYPTVEVIPENPNEIDNITVIVYGDTPNLII